MNFNQVWTKLKFFLVYMRRIPAAIAAVLSYINKSKNDPKLEYTFPEILFRIGGIGLI